MNMRTRASRKPAHNDKLTNYNNATKYEDVKKPHVTINNSLAKLGLCILLAVAVFGVSYDSVRNDDGINDVSHDLSSEHGEPIGDNDNSEVHDDAVSLMVQDLPLRLKDAPIILAIPVTQHHQQDGSTISKIASTPNTKPLVDRFQPSPIQQMLMSDFVKLPASLSHRKIPLLLPGITMGDDNDDSNKDSDETKLRQILQLENFCSTFGNYTHYLKDEKAQVLKDSRGRYCKAPASSIINMMNITESPQLLFFTTNIESPLFMEKIIRHHDIHKSLNYDLLAGEENKGVHTFSAMTHGSSHLFQQDDEAHFYQVHGRNMWYFLSPKATHPKRMNVCGYLTGSDPLPSQESVDGMYAVLQQPGDTVFVPKGWYRATCAIDEWSVAVGMQREGSHDFGPELRPIEQFYIHNSGAGDADTYNLAEVEKKIPMPWTKGVGFHDKMTECGVKFNANNLASWIWFNGNVGQYYNALVASDSKRDPNDIQTYAIHRWMEKGKIRSTLVHYELIFKAIKGHMLYYKEMEQLQLQSQEKSLRVQHRRLEDRSDGNDDGDDLSKDDDDDDTHVGLHVLDAGCGLGAGLMWFETNPSSRFWDMVGHSISEAQIDFIHNLPEHRFQADLKSYDDLEAYIDKEPFDVIYSIEAFIHSPNGMNTLQSWSKALAANGLIIIIDDFLSVGVDKNTDDVRLFKKSWMANTLYTSTEIVSIAAKYGLELVLDRDLGSEYEIVKKNYRNKLPELLPTKKKSHQGWLGSGMRQRLMVEGKLVYRMVVFQNKASNGKKKSKVQLSIEGRPSSTYEKECTVVQTATKDDAQLDIHIIEAQHKTGQGNDGGGNQKCISGWYCCGMGQQWWKNLEANRTDSTGYLKLPESLFGNYMDVIVKHLNTFYGTLSKDAKGKFLDIGGTGSVASGMRQVTSKFAHFAGPFDYWVLDSDPKAKDLSNAVFCDMSNCPVADDCAYDVTFSHTVLEHTPRPWSAFDTIARVTKRGGLSIHVVPFSYQYHATPDDNYRFSHKALTSLMEDRGFTVLEVGYDICEKSEKVLRTKRDEHFDVIWLTYVIARKN